VDLSDYHRLQRQEKQSWDLPGLERVALAHDSTFLDRLAASLPTPDERFAGDLVVIDRGPLFQKTTGLCQLYLESTPAQRTYIRSRIDWKLSGQLGGFGLAAAVVGVREHSPDLVRLGLAAFAVTDIGSDVRDILIPMALLFHCANRCGSGAQTLFQEAAAISGPAMSAVLLDFLERTAELQSLACMGWHEMETAEGPGYRHEPPKIRKPMDGQEALTQRAETSQQISSSLNPDQRNALIEMAGTLAAMAVRTQSPKLVEQGLQGLALGGGALDPSHSIVALAKLHHAALKLGIDAEKTFAEAARFAPPGNLQTEMIGFPLRPPKDRDLAAFNLQEEITEKGFGYKQVVPGNTQE
jgi:hypothetical protein